MVEKNMDDVGPMELLLKYYEDVTKPTEIAHDRLLDENKALKEEIKNLNKKIQSLENEVLRYRDIAQRVRHEKVMLLDTIERLNEANKS